MILKCSDGHTFDTALLHFIHLRPDDRCPALLLNGHVCYEILQYDVLPTPWEPGDSLAIVADDQTAEEGRDIEQLITDIKEICAPYGFKVRCWGTWQTIRKMGKNLDDFIETLIVVEDSHK